MNWLGTSKQLGFSVSICLSSVLAFATGCREADFGRVSGKVTLDGQPLEFCTVEFQPEGGSPAYGVTDEQGNYVLQFTNDQIGALVGKNVVRITSFRESKPRERERVPTKYNRQSELVRDVGPGNQTLNFDLVSK
ncbi:hypothetical protein ETAA8_26620 [Anatilimnocola aggregata]|uniref:Carboxypeptidase regulatory-like domain-containing protein n=1 Tax=Anatilimnocola aggregata TaxID=2528021 RepID=A0A517YBI1_9BACT|nr:carboxypeptidase regulatory-like domain-containing protein [Anatilimnocola aggregata]QDU27574.1 hypothetical protein ETAA8_26620 [Anatilimnocola aggregata]